MLVWTRLTASALRVMDAKGGYDEYMLTVSDDHMECQVAQMLRKKIALGIIEC